jgi:post-segregation antitoxin (ccd killing protein)
MPALMSTAHKLLQAGQARADRLIRSIEVSHLGRHIAEEVGALRATVRNLCAEVAAFENDDGTIAVELDGRPYGVWLDADGNLEFAQIAGIDVSGLLDSKALHQLARLARDARKERWAEDAIEARAELRAAA